MFLAAQRSIGLCTTLFTALACSDSTDPPAREESSEGGLWANCTVRELAGTVREMNCPTAKVRFMRAQALAGEPGVRRVLGLAPDAPVLSRRFAERVVPYATVLNGTRSKYACAPRGDILMLCTAAESDVITECELRAAWVANNGLPPGVAFPPVRLEIAGVPLEIPEGCELIGAERIACGEIALDWRNEARPGFDGVDAAYRAVGLTATAGEATECVVSGVRGDGDIVELVGRGEHLVVVRCSIAHEGQFAVAQCIGWDPRGGGNFPPPCDQVFSIPR